MRAKAFVLILLGLVLAAVVLVQAQAPLTNRELLISEQGARPAPAAIPEATKPRVVAAYGKLPLSFEANQGQTDGQVKFLSRGGGYTLFLTADEALLALRKPSAASPQLSATGEDMASAMPLGVPPNLGALAPEGRRGAARRFPQSGTAAFRTFFESPARTLAELNLEKPQGQTTDPALQVQSQTPDVLRMKLVGANPNPRVTGLDELPGKSNYFIGNDPNKWRTNVPNYGKVRYEEVYPGIDLVYYGNQRQLEYDFVVAPGADPNAIALEIDNGPLTPGPSPQGRGEELSALQPSPRGRGWSAAGGPGEGAGVTIDPNGDLVISTDAGEVRFHKPVVYQLVAPVSSPADRVAALYERRNSSGGDTPPLQHTTDNGPRTTNDAQSAIENRQYLEGRYTLLAHNQMGFELAAYDRNLPLIIDPVLSYSTYLGGSGDDRGNAIVVDAQGNAYVTGETRSSDFPTASPFQANLLFADAFVTKINPSGSAFVFSTYLGGSGGEVGIDIALDGEGSILLTGYTSSSDFPTANPVQPSFGGHNNDAFVAKLTAAGDALVYSTFLGGADMDRGYAIGVDTVGNAYVTGYTGSEDFPTANPFQVANGGSYDAFVAKLDAAGDALVYSTFLGGDGADDGFGIAVDTAGNAYITGPTASSNFPTTPGAFQTSGGGAFVTKINSAGTALVYSTLLTGATPFDIALDAEGNAYLTGYGGSELPTTPGAFQTSNSDGDAFVTKFNSAGAGLVYSTYVGGTLGDWGRGVAVDSAGNAYVTGETYSLDFPTVNPIQPHCNNCGSSSEDTDIFLAKLNTSGSALIFSTYLGGSSGSGGTEDRTGIAVDARGNTYVTGWTESVDFPTANPLQPDFAGGSWAWDAFVAKICAAAALDPTTLTFTEQVVGTTSADQTITLTNTGDSPLTIISVAASGDFDQTNTCGEALAAGANCTISVAFTPTARGSRTGKISITDDSCGSPYGVLLTGTGVEPAVALNVTSLTFGDQAVGTTGDPQSLTLTNTGNGTLTITSIAVSEDFAETNDCGASVAVGASCTISVTFTPTATGTRDGTLTITDNAPGSPHTVNLSGTGTDFSLAIAPDSSTSATVDAGQTATYDLTLTPEGFSGTASMSCTGAPQRATCTVSPTSVTLDGTNPADVTVSVATRARSMVPPGPFGNPPAIGWLRSLPLQIWLPLVLATLVMLAGKSRRVTKQLCATGLAMLSGVKGTVQRRVAWGLTLAIVLALLWVGCGGEAGPTPPPQVGTPAGTYTLTVTATSGEVSRSTTLSLTVN